MTPGFIWYLLHTVQRAYVLYASSPFSFSEQDVGPSWKPRESSPQTPTYEQSEGCIDKDLRKRSDGLFQLYPHTQICKQTILCQSALLLDCC